MEIMIKETIKKETALIIVVSMLAGFSLSVADSTKLHAAIPSEPSVTAYASKADLENKFAPDSGNIGKLKFGKDANCSVQEWYILGSDSGVNGGEDNTAIFAASNMTGYLGFQMKYIGTDNDEKYFYNGDRDIGNIGVNYISGTFPTKFYANHYGLSDARNTLKEMVNASSSCFTSKECELINETTVTTEDLLNKNTHGSYTTSDKLYLPCGNSSSNQIYIGTDDSKELDGSKYWKTGDYFWLRTPSSEYSYGYFEICAAPGKGIRNRGSVGGDQLYGVRPASNLNLLTSFLHPQHRHRRMILSRRLEQK